MGLVESRANGRRDGPLEAFKMREREAIPLIWITAPGSRDMKIIVFPATALKFLRKAR
jgi:hypothetical protein